MITFGVIFLFAECPVNCQGCSVDAGETVAKCTSCNDDAVQINSHDGVAGSCHSTLLSSSLSLFLCFYFLCVLLVPQDMMYLLTYKNKKNAHHKKKNSLKRRSSKLLKFVKNAG